MNKEIKWIPISSGIKPKDGQQCLITVDRPKGYGDLCVEAAVYDEYYDSWVTIDSHEYHFANDGYGNSITAWLGAEPYEE